MNTDEYNAGFEAGMEHAKDLIWHYLTGQATAESAQDKKPMARQTKYLRDALERFLKGTIDDYRSKWVRWVR